MLAMLVVGVADAEAGGSRTSNSAKAPKVPSPGTGVSSQTTLVKGHTTKSGTYVAPHTRTKADDTPRNNYSTKGNTNPHTGKKGTRKAKP